MIFTISISSFSPISSQLILQEAFVLLTIFIPMGALYPITIYLFLIYEDTLTYQNKGKSRAIFSLKLLEGRDKNRCHHTVSLAASPVINVGELGGISSTFIRL